jgi:arylsulfatase
VLFTSDHGPWYQGSAGLLRGRKASTFEGGFRVPMLAQWSGTIEAGKVSDTWCSNLDILPTLSTVCGLALPLKPLDGVDISGALSGRGELPERKPVLYFSPMGNQGTDVHCIRKEQWKLRVAQGIEGEIYLNDRSTGAKASSWLQRPELYDVSLDMAESYDVAHLHPEIVRELSESLEAQMLTFQPEVIEAYTKLKLHKGDLSTPPGASPRPFHVSLPDWSWTPEDLREPS